MYSRRIENDTKRVAAAEKTEADEARMELRQGVLWKLRAEVAA